MLLRLQLFTGSKILTGAQAGRSLFAKLLANTSSPIHPEPAFLDFTGIDVATSSFLRESIITFRDYARSTLPTLYPVMANANEAVTEEFTFFLRHRAEAFWACDLDRASRPTNIRLLGELDQVQRETLDLVLNLGSASAPTLAATKIGANDVGPTAWNNRLSNLATRGLLVERRSGKTKTFAPVLEAN